MTETKKSVVRVVNGWQVRVCLPDGTIYRKRFADRNHGGEQGSFQSACLHRDEVEVKCGKPRIPGVHDKPHMPVGVEPDITEHREASGRHFFMVTWREQSGVVKRTSVSVNKHGHDHAYEIAKEIRQSKMKVIHGVD